MAASNLFKPNVPKYTFGLLGWWDGSDLRTLFQDSSLTTPVAANSDPVGGWLDKSGNGRTLTQATGANKPTYQTNVQAGRSILRFANPKFLRLNGFVPFNTNFTVIAAVSRVNTTEVTFAGDDTDSTLGVAWRTNPALGAFRAGVAGFSSTTPYTTAFSVPAWTSLGGTGTVTVDCSINGGNSTAAVPGPGIIAQTNFLLGASSAGLTPYLNGDLGEFVIYNRILSAAELAVVTTYLRIKWGTP